MVSSSFHDYIYTLFYIYTGLRFYLSFTSTRYCHRSLKRLLVQNVIWRAIKKERRKWRAPFTKLFMIQFFEGNFFCLSLTFSPSTLSPLLLLSRPVPLLIDARLADDYRSYNLQRTSYIHNRKTLEWIWNFKYHSTGSTFTWNDSTQRHASWTEICYTRRFTIDWAVQSFRARPMMMTTGDFDKRIFPIDYLKMSRPPSQHQQYSHITETKKKERYNVLKWPQSLIIREPMSAPPILLSVMETSISFREKERERERGNKSEFWSFFKVMTRDETRYIKLLVPPMLAAQHVYVMGAGAVNARSMCVCSGYTRCCWCYPLAAKNKTRPSNNNLHTLWKPTIRARHGHIEREGGGKRVQQQHTWSGSNQCESGRKLYSDGRQVGSIGNGFQQERQKAKKRVSNKRNVPLNVAYKIKSKGEKENGPLSYFIKVLGVFGCV